MATNDMENYIITRTFTDGHGRHGELLYDQQLKGHAPNALSSCPRCLGCPSCRLFSTAMETYFFFGLP